MEGPPETTNHRLDPSLEVTEGLLKQSELQISWGFQGISRMISYASVKSYTCSMTPDWNWLSVAVVIRCYNFMLQKLLLIINKTHTCMEL